MPAYMTVKLFIRYGPALAAIVAISLLLCVAWLLVTTSMPWPFAMMGVAASLLIGFFILVFVDLTKIIAEMLLPR